MNVDMIKKLMLKDWHFNRMAIGGYMMGGLISLLMMRNGLGPAFHVGTVLLFSVLLGMGIHMTIVTVVNERKEKTLPFIMSLPISVKEYTTAKLVANITLFFIPWAVLFIAGLFFLIQSPHFGDGLIPYVVATMISIFMGYVILVALSLVSESMAWTIVGIVGCNLLLQVFIHMVPRLEGIGAHIAGPVAVWNQTAVMLAVGQVLVVIVTLILTYVFQARKKDFT